MATPVARGVLLELAAEGLVPVLGGCAGILAGGPEAGLAGVAVGQAVEKAINFFGGRIVERWCAWFRGQPAEARQVAVAELASMTSEEARKEARATLSRMAPEARPEDLNFALEYLSAIPRTMDRALLRDPATGACALPPTVTFDEPHLLLQMLPTDVPPYAVPTELPTTQYVLEQLLGSGGFGAVYRATTRSLQHLPLAIKFCLDPTLAAALHRERSNLERLMKVGGENWSPRIVRLYGYDLDHRTPYLVYEYVSGGDLTHHLAVLRQRKGRELNADEVLDLILQVTEGLAFAHRHGLVHRDLKPANVLVEGETLKLADFGLGGVSAVRAVQVSRIGATTLDFLTVAERASLFRGAGTPLYMSPEQRRGAPPDPRQDLYSLGVMWFQLLVGDVTRELHPGWAKELAIKHRVPANHLELIGRCVGWIEERPRDAAELLPLLRDLKNPDAPAAIPVAKVAPAPAPQAAPSGPVDLRQTLQVSLVKQLQEAQQQAARHEARWGIRLGVTAAAGIVLVIVCTAIGGAGDAAWGGMAIGILLAAGLVYLFLWVNSYLQQQARTRVETTLRTLAEEFPEPVRQWGGLTVLRTPSTVTEVLKRLPGSAPLPEPVVKPPTAAPLPQVQIDKRSALAEKLGELARAQDRAAWYGERKALPWWLALLCSALVLGVPGGVVTGMLFMTAFEPVSNSGYGRPIEYYDAHGSVISPMDYAVTNRHLGVLATLIGLGAGFVLIVLGTSLLAFFRWYRLALLLGVLVGAFVGWATGCGAGALFYYYFSPDSQYAPGLPGSQRYFNIRGEELTRVQYNLEQRQVVVQAAVIGVPTGYVLGLLVLPVVQWRWARRKARLRRDAADKAGELAAAFPDVVSSWGGVERLQDRQFVEEARSQAETAR
jgi:serine/threonine protein kinase